MESKPTRRAILLGSGAVAGSLAVGGCTPGEDPYAPTKPDVPGSGDWTKGEEKWVASACSQCFAGCGIRVRVVEGRAVKIEGNREFPVNHGGLGPKGQAGLQLLYHPDRVRTALRRRGPRGSGDLEEVSWDGAIAEIGDRLRKVREAGSPEGLVVIDGDPRGPMHALWSRFLEAYGSPNHVDHRSAGEGGSSLAMEFMQGVPEIPAYDWHRVRYVLAFGSALFESWCQAIHLVRRPSGGRTGLPGGRAKVIQIAPRFSTTAAKADEWVPIRPGTYGALALGLGHVLVREGLHDREFVAEHGFGFEAWTDAQGREHRGFRELLLEDYPPERAAQITGMPEEQIERLAHEMAEQGPAVALSDGPASSATNGIWTALAIHGLNGLLGNVERKGGILAQFSAPLADWSAVEGDEVAHIGKDRTRLDGAGTARCALGRSSTQGLLEGLLTGDPYPAQAVFLYRSNPIFSKPEGSRWAEALERVPLVVSFTPLHDESALWADYVLPDPTYLERWEIIEPIPSVGYGVVGLRQPAVKPLYDTRPTGDVVIQLAQAIGGAVEQAFPWKSYQAALLERLRGLVGIENGGPAPTSMSSLGKALRKHGGWWKVERPLEQWEEALRTPSGRFEFYSQEVESRLAESFGSPGELEAHLEASKIQARGDELCLPHYEEPTFLGDPADFPFVLLPHRGNNYAEGGIRHLPWLRELPRAGRLEGWKEWIEMNPADAASSGFQGGDEVVVKTPVGSRRLLVRLDDGIRPGTLGLPLGYGVWPPDPSVEKQTGGWSLVASRSDPLAGILALEGTRARVERSPA